MSAPGKQYGLILSKKKETPVIAAKPLVFDSGSDSDEEEKRTSMKKTFSKQQIKTKTQLEIRKVLEEDPTAYEYDSVYDAMKEKKEAKLSEATIDRKPKYIQTLLKAADSRKKEYERRVERKIQKEREEEGEKFADKEAFVTSAYKKKMQEQQEEEEKEKRMDAIEALMDVTKQKDLTGFYRHLLKKQTSDPEKEIKKERSSSVDKEIRNNGSPENKSPSATTTSFESSSTLIKNKESMKDLRKSDETKKSLDTADADSDFSSDSESSSSDSNDSEVQLKESKQKHVSQSDNARKRKTTQSSSSVKQVVDNSSLEKRSKPESKDRDDDHESASDSDVSEHESLKNTCTKPVLSVEEKLNILFAKRTVGDAFIAAQERYWQRKAQGTTNPAAISA